MNVLGLSCYFHDSAACLVRDGRVIAAAQEERFSRKKHDAALPVEAARYCLQEGGISADELDAAIFYEKPLLKLERLLLSHFRVWPRALRPFLSMQQQWLGGKMRIRSHVRSRLGYRKPLLFCRHHESHAASAFFASPFERATVVTLDGVGEWATTAIFLGEGNRLKPVAEIRFPDSLGLFYSAFTYYLGFEVNEDEYKVMGLAPYGKPRFAPLIEEKVLRLVPEGGFELDMGLFRYEAGDRMLDERKAAALFGFPARRAGEPIEAHHQDLAASIQHVLEKAVIAVCEEAVARTGEPNLCLAGGVALNCLANARVKKSPKIKDLYIFPAAGDAGGAVGAALFAYYGLTGAPRTMQEFPTPLLGPAFAQEEIDRYLARAALPHRKLDRAALLSTVAKMLVDQRVVGWFQGRMEFGPRALGNRSILGDPRQKENWQRINRKVKFREDFRPLAPSVLEEAAPELFEPGTPSPYMLLTAQNRTEKLPAVTHVDGSSRLQTVSRDENPLYHALISEFAKLTGVPAVINTSFNTAGMPIVCTPQNAFQCFAESDLDVLVLGDCVLEREALPWLPRREGTL